MTKISIPCDYRSEDFVEVSHHKHDHLVLQMHLPSIAEEDLAHDGLMVIITKESALELATQLIALVTLE